MVQQHAMTEPTSTYDSMYVERWGSGPPLVFVHGGGADGVALLVISDHLHAAVEAQDGDVAIQEMITVLRAALRQ